MNSYSLKIMNIRESFADRSAFLLVLVLLLFSYVLINPGYANSSTMSLPEIVVNNPGERPLSGPNQLGIIDLIAKEAFRRSGYNLIVKELPAERALRSANKGIIDGDLMRIRGLEKIYPNLVRIPEKINDMYFVAFSKQSVDLSAGWQSISDYNVALINGWKIFENNIPGTAKITKVKNGEQLFTLLSRDRTDIALFNRISGNYLLGKLKINQVTELSPPLAIMEMYIYLHKKHKNLVPLISKALAEMKSDGTYDRIMNTGKSKAK